MVPAFVKLLSDPNPCVITNLLDKVDKVLEMAPDALCDSQDRWIRLATMCKDHGVWRLHKLFYEKTAPIVYSFGREQMGALLNEFQVCFVSSPKPVIPAIIACVLQILKSPVLGLRDEMLTILTQDLAMSKSSLQRLICLDVMKEAML